MLKSTQILNLTLQVAKQMVNQSIEDWRQMSLVGMEIHKLYMFYTILGKSNWISDTEDLLQVKSRSPR